MMKNEDLINAFFEGSLTEYQKLEFQNRKVSDPDFLEELEFQSQLKKAIEAEERASLKKQLQAYDSTIYKNKKLLKTFAVAASFILLFTVSGILLYNYRPNTSQLYSQNFQEFPNISHPIVRSAGEQSLIDKAFEAYDKKDYKESALLFSKVDQDEAFFYKALSEMMLKQYDNAAKDFGKIDYYSFPLKEHLLWYQSLNDLKLGKTIQAKARLKTIKEGIYKEKAEKLLSNLH